MKKSVTVQFGQAAPIHKGTATHCPYCAFQCGMYVSGESQSNATVIGNPTFPVNKGGLCVKGWNAPATLSHPERLCTPLIRNEQGGF